MTRGFPAGVARRLAERDEIGFHGTLGPRGIHRQHREHTVTMFLRYQQRIAAQHQFPTDGRVTRGVRSAIPNAQPPQRPLPPPIRITHIWNRCALVGEEQMVVLKESLVLEAGAQLQMPLQDRHGARTELNASIVAGLRAILIDPSTRAFVTLMTPCVRS